MEEKTGLDLGKTNIHQIFWTYAIPSILMMIVQSTAGFIDSFFVGRYVGVDGLAAITLIMPLILFLIGVGTMVAIGGTTLAGIEKGAGNNDKSNNYFNVTTRLLLMSGVLGSILIYIIIPTLANIIGAERDVLFHTVTYARYISLFIPFFLLSFAFSFFLKLDGKPVATVMVMLSGTLTNIVLDYFFVAKLGMGIKGAALATGISQTLPAIIFFVLIIYKTNWTFKKPRYSFSEIKGICYNGSSEFLTNIATAVTGMAFNYIVMNRLGGNGVAAFSVSLQIAAIASSIGYGIAEGGQVALSYNFGAKQYNRVKQIRNLSLVVSFLLGIILAVTSLIFSTELASVFLTDTSTINLANNILKYYAISFLFLCVNINIVTYYTAINDPLRSAGIALYRSLIAALLGLSTLPLLFGQNGIWLTIIFVESSALIIGFFMLKRNPLGRLKLSLIQGHR
ncbi:putative MATE family efflux protein [Natronobacillus azotifigens]|uniref:MATE family efflux transporter n=1 Tax=Natronobacillus azotifigens TaxID=472978 RepID=A0A9J6RB51_9BACI|nr:MATE family efflux transporter [Natronobacillus azotifigens]